MVDERIREKAHVTDGRSVELSTFVVSLHGFVLLVGWHAPFTTNLPLAIVGLLAGLLPFGVYVRRPGTPRREAILGMGLVPATWLVVSAVFMSTMGTDATALDALRTSAGLLAHLGAASERARMRETRRAVETSEHVRSSPDAPQRRHGVRIALLALLVGPLTLSVALTPFMVAGATRFERTFSALAGSVLASSLLLTILPPLVRRERRAASPTSKRATTAALAMLTAAVALGVERLTR